LVLSDRFAVMNSGNIQLLGGRGYFFERPETASVADFIGQMNYIACTVVEVDTGKCRLKVDGAERNTIECFSREGLAPQEPIVVRIRPHSVEVRRSPSRDGRPCLECTVSIAAYLGDHIEYELSLGNQTIAAGGEASLEMKRGDKAFAVLDPAAIVLVPK
jgi:ABC-type Fe3+/spermidine/putrescine transport system ATPase subunit